MSFENIMESKSNPKLPPDNVLECLSKLIENINPCKKLRKLTPSQELCSIFNKISTKNIGILLPKCKDILLKNKIEYNTIQKLVDIISSQPLHLDTYSTIICAFSKEQTLHCSSRNGKTTFHKKKRRFLISLAVGVGDVILFSWLALPRRPTSGGRRFSARK